MAARKKSMRTSREPQRRRSRTQAEYLASLRWNIRDAEEALINAVRMRSWENVIRYTRQIQVLERREYDTQQLGARRRFDPRRPGGTRMTTREYEASERARQRGRSGPP